MLSISLYERTIGYLSIENQCIHFEYDPLFQDNGMEISPFLLPLSVNNFTSRVSEDSFRGLPEFISDALPDRFGNQVINSYFESQGIESLQVNVLNRLSYIGKTAIGALEFEPQDDYLHNYQAVLDVSNLVEDAQYIFGKRLEKVSSLLMSTGSSAGGARPKALIGATSDFKNIIAGHYDVPDDFEHYIIKFDGVDVDNIECDPQGYSNIEYAYFLMARAAGINMMDSCLFREGERQHFVTKRFDRDKNQKIHVQSLCALTGIDFNAFQSGSYSDYFTAVVNLGLSFSEQKEAFRRMVFNVLAINRDDHTKNFSFILSPSGYWSLAPAYDVTHAYNEKNPNAWTREHNLLINGKGLNITMDDIFAESSVLSLSTSQKKEIIQDVISTVKEWPEFAKQATVKRNKVPSIEQHIKTAINDLKLSMSGRYNG